MKTHCQFLSFAVGSEEYGIDILKVQELRSYVEPTVMPNSPPAVRGVINLRGDIVPIVDLRISFGVSATYSAFTVVMVVNVDHKSIGLVVDSVSDVVDLDPAEIKPRPPYGDSVVSDHVLGLAQSHESLLILLDIEKLVSSKILFE